MTGVRLRRLSRIIALVVAASTSLCLPGCSEWQSVEDVCEQYEGALAIEAAYKGDLAAVECLIESNREAKTYFDYIDPDDLTELRYGYIHWRISGERSERALEIAKAKTRDEVLMETALTESFMTFTPPPDIGADDCWIVNPVQVELMLVAKPDPLTDACMASYRMQAGIAAP